MRYGIDLGLTVATLWWPILLFGWFGALSAHLSDVIYLYMSVVKYILVNCYL
jgi:hypothetical protein